MKYMNSCIITGATSMIGIATVKACVENGVRVLAIMRPGSRRKQYLPKTDLVEFYECDLSEIKNIQREEKYDVLIHFGWGFTDRSTRDDPHLQYNNIKYTLDAVELAHRTGCKSFVGAGSQAEYGFQDVKISEETAPKPEVSYGICKLSAGLLARKMCDKNEMICIWTRIFSVYGPHDSENVMTSYAVHQFLDRKPAEFSAGSQLWNYLYEDDAGRYMFFIAENARESMIVNVANPETKLLYEYIEEMKGALGDGFETIIDKTRVGRGINPSVEKMIALTGYYPQTSFSEGICKIRDLFLEEKTNRTNNRLE